MSWLNKAEQYAEDATGFARAIAAKRATIVAAVGVAAQQLVAHHVITPDVSHTANGVISWGLGAAAFIGGITWVRAGVTPSDPAKAPVSSNGQRLVEASVAAQMVQAAGQPAKPAFSDTELAAMDAAAAVTLAQNAASPPAPSLAVPAPAAVPAVPSV